MIQFSQIRDTLYKDLFDYANNHNNQTNQNDLYNINSENAGNIKNLNCLNISEKTKILCDIYNETKINNELLKYELLFFEPNEKINDLQKLANFIQEAFNKFTWTTGGYNLDDNYWNLHFKDSKKYEINDNQFIIDNSFNQYYKYDTELFDFLQLLKKYFNRISSNFSISLKYLYDSNRVIWTTFICTSKENIKLLQ